MTDFQLIIIFLASTQRASPELFDPMLPLTSSMAGWLPRARFSSAAAPLEGRRISMSDLIFPLPLQALSATLDRPGTVVAQVRCG